MKLLSKVLLAGALGATVMATAAPAEAHGWHRGGGGAGLAIGAGILGVAVGAAIASDHPHRGYVVEEGYAPPPPPPSYYYEGPAYYGGYYAPPPPPPRTYVYREVYRSGPAYYGYGGYPRWHRGW